MMTRMKRNNKALIVLVILIIQASATIASAQVKARQQASVTVDSLAGAKVYDRMISERKRIAAEKRSMGEGRKAEILGRVERELKEITSGAQKEAVTIKGEADAKATKIYGETYSRYPEFYSFQQSLESYPDIITDNTSLILSSDSDLFKYLETIEGKGN